MQREVMLLRAHTSVVCAGRGTGKGLLQALMCLENMQAMPRSTTAFVSPSLRRALTNTLPSMLQHWEAWGYKRGVHWVIGQRPPARLRWPRPLIAPEHWENVLSLYNGSIVQIISQERKGTSNSCSFDFVLIDEAKFVNFERLKSETFPANRGQVDKFGHLPFHHGMLITSDMPVTRRGSWFLNYEQQMNAVRIRQLRETVMEQWKLEGGDAGDAGEAPALPGHPRSQGGRALRERLFELRRDAVFFGRYPSTVNLEVLGEAWFRQMKRELPPEEFRTSILCLPPEKLRDGFYSSLTEENIYQWPDLTDVQQGEPLCVAFDFNANINCLVCGQPDEESGRLNVLSAHWVKYERRLPELVQDFCAWWGERVERREVVFYYDSTALGSNYAVNREDFAWVICRQFEKAGWIVRAVSLGRPMRHHEKHLLINRMLKGEARLRAFFNEERCEVLIGAMREAAVYDGHKDKRMEKRPETEESPLETRTDITDALDTLMIGCECQPQMRAGLMMVSDFGQ